MSFRTIAGFSLPKGLDDYEEYTRQTINQMKPGGDLACVLINADEFFKSGAPDRICKQAALKTLQSAQRVVDSVSLVFAHSVLDDYLYQLIELAYHIDYSVLLPFINDQKVKVSEVVEDCDGCVRSKLERWLAAFDRASLLVKTDCLYSICSPDLTINKHGQYKFDRARLKTIDDRRHHIIHEPDIAGSIDNIGSDLRYLELTGGHFLYQMHKRFDLKIIPAAFGAPPTTGQGG